MRNPVIPTGNNKKIVFVFFNFWDYMPQFKFVRRISVYFILFGLSICPFFDVMALPSDVQEDPKTRFIGI